MRRASPFSAAFAAAMVMVALLGGATVVRSLVPPTGSITQDSAKILPWKKLRFPRTMFRDWEILTGKMPTDLSVYGKVFGGAMALKPGIVDGMLAGNVNGTYWGTLDGTLNGTISGSFEGTFNGTINGFPVTSRVNYLPAGRPIVTINGDFNGALQGKFAGSINADAQGTWLGALNHNDCTALTGDGSCFRLTEAVYMK